MLKQILDKKVKKSTKYGHVKSVLSQGKTMKDVEIMSMFECSFHMKLLGDQLVAKKKSEKFKRIKCSTLAKLLQEQTYEESVYKLASQEMIGGGPGSVISVIKLK